MEESWALSLKALLERLREEGVAKVMLHSDWYGDYVLAWTGSENKTGRLPLGTERLLVAGFLETFPILIGKEWFQYALLDLEGNRLHLRGRVYGGKELNQSLRFGLGDLLRGTPLPQGAEGFLPSFDLWGEEWTRREGFYEKKARGVLASDAWKKEKKKAMGLVPHLIEGVRQRVKREERWWFWARVRRTQGVDVDLGTYPLVEEVFPLDQALKFS